MRRRFPRLRRVLRRIGIGLGVTIGVVLALVLGALAIVLWTPWGTRTALTFALERYDGAVPGGISVAEIHGTLGGELVLDGLELHDGDENPLIAAAHVELELRLAELVGMTVGFDRLAVDGLEVWIGGERARFGDLGPDTPPKPKPEGMVGPDLPIGFSGALVVEDLVIHQWKPDGQLVQLVGGRIDAALVSHGREAELRVNALTAMLGAPELTVAGASMTVRWADPEVRIEELVALTNRGIVQRADVGFDAFTQTGDADIAALVDVAALAPESQLPLLGPVAVELRGAGGAESVWASIGAGDGVDARVDLLLGGSISPRLELAGLGAMRVHPQGARAPIGALIAAQVLRLPDQPMHGAAQVRCIGCTTPTGLVAHSTTLANGDATEVDARLFIADGDVEASATIADGVLTQARAHVELPSLPRVEHTLSPWLTLPEIGGSLSADASCTGREALLRCRARMSGHALSIAEARLAELGLTAAVTIEDGKPDASATLRAEQLQWKQHRVARLRVDASGTPSRLRVLASAHDRRIAGSVLAVVEPGPHTDIALHSLALDYDTLHVRLGRPSHIGIGGGKVAIDGLRLRVNGGAIDVDGVIGPHSDADVAVEHIDLADLGPLKLPVELRGIVEARAHVAGTMKSPSIAMILDAGRLGIDEHELGRIGTELAFQHGLLSTSLSWQPSKDEHVELRARAQLRPFGDRRGPGLQPRAPLLVELDADNLALARLQPLVGEHEIAGRLGTSLRIAGTGAEPVVVASVDGTALRYDDVRVSTVHAEVEHLDGRVDVDVEARAPWMRSVSLTASAPVRVSGVAPYAELDREGDASLGLVLDRLELAGLEDIVPGLDLAGRVDGELGATVKNGELAARTNMLARDVARNGERIATVALEATLAPEGLRAKLQASGAAARLLEVDADVPVGLDVRTGKPTWQRSKPHHVQLELADVDVAAIGRLAGVGGIAGRIGGDATLDGPATAPALDVGLVGRRLAWGGKPLGRVELEVHQAGKRLHAHVKQERGVARLRLDADVPIRVDLTSGGVDWDRDGDHRVELDAVAIDEKLLAPFVALPDELTFVAHAELEARGNLKTFAAKGQLRADVGDAKRKDTPVAAHLSISPEKQAVDVVIGPFEDSALELVATTQAPLHALFATERFDWKQIPIVASFDTDHFPLTGLGPLLPDAIDQPVGRLDAHVAAAGTLGKPGLRGNVRLRDAAITVVPLRQRFDRVALQVALDGADIELVRLAARSGSGHASGKGRIHLARGGTKGQLELRLDGLPIVRPGMPLMKLSTRATAELDATGERTLIEVVARKNTLDVFTASVTAPTALPTTEGVVFVDTRGRAAQRKEDKAAAREPLLPPDMNVKLTLADPVFVRGPQANMSWRGGIELDRDNEKIRAHGALTCDRGRINFLGHDFVIDSGRVTLPERGELDPYIALTAVTQTEEGEVTIDVHGRASRPELRLSSDPPLPESDVFALLVTGSSGGADEGEGGEVEAKAANLLVAFQNPVLQRELQDRLGIDRVGVSFGDNVDQPIVAVGKRVSRKVYLETRYHHNAPKDQNNAEIHLEYSIKAPHWSVETFIGDAAKGGLEVWWRTRFGRPPAPVEAAEQPAKKPATAKKKEESHGEQRW